MKEKQKSKNRYLFEYKLNAIEVFKKIETLSNQDIAYILNTYPQVVSLYCERLLKI